MCQLTDFFGSTGNNRTTTDENIWFLCFFDHLCSSFKIFLTNRFNFTIDRSRTAYGIFISSCCHIFCHINQYRTRTSALGNVKCLAECVCQHCDVFYNKAVFCNRHNDSCNIYFLERISSKKWFANIRRDCHNRNGIHISCSNTCNQIRSPRS